MGDVNAKKEQAPHALEDLLARVGKNNPKLLEAVVAGVSDEELVSQGATIATSRILVDAVRLYGEGLDFYEHATAAQKTLLRGASPELFSVAIHHLETLRKLEAQAVERSTGTSKGRALVDEDLRDATAKATGLRDQAYSAMRDAGQTKRHALEVDAAFGVADPPEKLAAGLDAMSGLLRDWLGSGDAALRTRLVLASLDKSFAAELAEGAVALTTALVAANKRNSHKARQAELDREDGVQILLLGQIIRAFESAHDRSRTIPRLVPISTRRLFNRNKKSAAEPAEPAKADAPVTP